MLSSKIWILKSKRCQCKKMLTMPRKIRRRQWCNRKRLEVPKSSWRWPLWQRCYCYLLIRAHLPCWMQFSLEVAWACHRCWRRGVVLGQVCGVIAWPYFCLCWMVLFCHGLQTQGLICYSYYCRLQRYYRLCWPCSWSSEFLDDLLRWHQALRFSLKVCDLTCRTYLLWPRCWQYC